VFSDIDTTGVETHKRTTQLADRFEAALLALDPFISERLIIQAVASGLSGLEIHAKIIAPAMHELGRLWAIGKVSLSVEHCASEICLRVLPIVRPTLQTSPPHSRERIVIGTVAGERHAIGARMAADVLEGAGYDVHFLGADVPPGELISAVLGSDAQVVGLGITMPESRPALDIAMDALAVAAPDCVVVLGGPSVPQERRGAGWPCVSSVEDVVSTFAHAGDIARRSPGAGRHARRQPGNAIDLGLGAARRVRADIRSAEARMEASRDLLTDLPNRQAMNDYLFDLQQHADLEAADYTLAAISIDGMHSVNERHGRQIGDTVLVRVARMIQGKSRENDFVARISGDEIAVVFSRTGVLTATRLAERLRKEVKALRDMPSVTASVGVTAFEGNANVCMMHVESAVDDAKQTGGDTVYIAS
jgi:diguanylate cyclase (GGDEF)-like protein